MKNESEDIEDLPGDSICDFCGLGKDFLWSLNEGLWAVCTTCMNSIYGGEEE